MHDGDDVEEDDGQIEVVKHDVGGSPQCHRHREDAERGRVETSVVVAGHGHLSLDQLPRSVLVVLVQVDTARHQIDHRPVVGPRAERQIAYLPTPEY